MSWTPISHTVPQYHVNGLPASGWVLKFYASGTSTNIVNATDSTGGTTQADVVLNASGFPAVSGSVFIPHIDQDYKLALYATQAAADADSGALWSVDTLSQPKTTDANVLVSSNDTTAGVLNGKLTAGDGIAFTENNNGADEDLGIAVDPTATLAVVGVTATGGRFQGAIGTPIASATAMPDCTDGDYAHVTGTTDITSIATTGKVGTIIYREFDGILTLAHHATNLILPGGANIITKAGAVAVLVEYGSGTFKLIGYLDYLPTPTQIGGDYIKLSDVQTSGTDGGTFTSGAWRTRVLNTEDSDTGNHCTLATNQFTLAAGTYRILATAPAYSVNDHKAHLYNITDAADELVGSSNNAGVTGAVQSGSVVRGLFTISGSKAFEIQHQCLTTKTNNGLGTAASFGTEVYTVVELWKVA